MNYDYMKSRFRIGDKYTISGGKPWTIVGFIDDEKIVVAKRVRFRRNYGQWDTTPEFDYDILRESDIEMYGINLRAFQ